MSHPAVPSPAAVAVQSLPVRPLPVRHVLPWLALAAVLVLVAFYLVAAEEGAVRLLSGTPVHEWVHDGRHLLGFPCH